jgi:hypothetical protein
VPSQLRRPGISANCCWLKHGRRAGANRKGGGAVRSVHLRPWERRSEEPPARPALNRGHEKTRSSGALVRQLKTGCKSRLPILPGGGSGHDGARALSMFLTAPWHSTRKMLEVGWAGAVFVQGAGQGARKSLMILCRLAQAASSIGVGFREQQRHARNELCFDP